MTGQGPKVGNIFENTHKTNHRNISTVKPRQSIPVQVIQEYAEIYGCAEDVQITRILRISSNFSPKMAF